MEKSNGRIEKVMGRGKIKALDMGGNNPHHSHWRFLWLASPLFLSGCAALKKAAIVSSVSSLGAGVGSVLSGTVGSIAGAATGATAGVIATGLGEPKEVISQPLELTAETVVTHAPTNLWDVVSQLGLWAGLIILIPLVLGILLPGPVQFKKK